MARARSLLRKVFSFLFLLAVVGSLVWGVQMIWHPLDPVIQFVDQDVNAVGTTLSVQIVAGISLTSLCLFLVFTLIPLGMRGVHNGQFMGSFTRGILSAAVFLVSNWCYDTLRGFGRFWMLVGILTMVIVTVVLIELITRAGSSKSEVNTRTDLLASVSSGLAFSLLVNLGTWAWNTVGHAVAVTP